jgi:hypothetical protein
VACYPSGTVLLFMPSGVFWCGRGITYREQTYGSAVSSPSNASGVATFENIGLFDLPDGNFFQVFVLTSTLLLHNLYSIDSIILLGCVCICSGCIWFCLEQRYSDLRFRCGVPTARVRLTKINNKRYTGIASLPYYRARNIISTCSITRNPTSAISENSRFLISPFSVQVSNRQDVPFRIVIASVHIIVRQDGVIVKGASSVVDPFTGTASFVNFKLATALNLESITYDVVSNGVICSPESSWLPSLLQAAQASISGNRVAIATVPSAVIIFPDNFTPSPIRIVFVGVSSLSVAFAVLDANSAQLFGVVVQIKVSRVLLLPIIFVVFLDCPISHHAIVLRCVNNIGNSYQKQALNSSISLQGLSGQDFPQAVSFPNSALSFVVTSAVTGTYQLYVAIPFVVQVLCDFD